MVAWLETPDILAGLLYNPRALVSEYGRLIRGVPTLMHAYVSVADAHGNDTYENLVVTWALELQALYLERPGGITRDRSLNLQPFSGPLGTLSHVLNLTGIVASSIAVLIHLRGSLFDQVPPGFACDPLPLRGQCPVRRGDTMTTWRRFS